MKEDRMLDLDNNTLERMRMMDIFTRAGLGIFSLAVIWFASSLLIRLVQ